MCTMDYFQQEQELTVSDIQEGNKHSEQTGHSYLTHELPITVVGTEGQSALP